MAIQESCSENPMRRSRNRYRTFAVTITLLVALVTCLYLWSFADSGLDSVLGEAGLPALPESATDVAVVEKGEDLRSTYIRFSAIPHEIEDFIDGTTSKKARDRPITLSSVNWIRPAYPPWWVPKECDQGRVYYLERGNVGGVIAVDDDSHTVYVSIWQEQRSWLRWLRRHF